MRWLRPLFRRYAVFAGRAGRREFARFVLFVVLVFAAIIGAALGYATLAERTARTLPLEENEGWLQLMLILAFLFGAVMLVPAAAIGVRRLHDIDRSGWWMLVPGTLIWLGPLGAGAVVELVFSGLRVAALVLFLVFLCLRGTSGPNRFGPDPKDRHTSLA